MAIIRIVNGWDKETPLDLLGSTRFIINQMTGNSNFSTPTLTLVEMTTLANDFDVLIQKAEAGGVNERNPRDDKAAEVIDALHQLGDYVVFTAKGDKTVAESSGFTLAKDPSPRPPIEKPQGLQLFDGMNAGELLLKFIRVRGSRAYMYQVSLDPADESKWVTVHGTIRQNLFTGLESGKKYYVRVAAIGTDGQMVYSDVVSRIVQ